MLSRGLRRPTGKRARHRAIRDASCPARDPAVGARLGVLAAGRWCDRDLRGHGQNAPKAASCPRRQARARSGLWHVGFADRCPGRAGRVGDPLFLLRSMSGRVSEAIVITRAVAFALRAPAGLAGASRRREARALQARRHCLGERTLPLSLKQRRTTGRVRHRADRQVRTASSGRIASRLRAEAGQRARACLG